MAFREIYKFTTNGMKLLVFNPNYITITDEDGQHPNIQLPSDMTHLYQIGYDYASKWNAEGDFLESYNLANNYVLAVGKSGQAIEVRLGVKGSGESILIGSYGAGNFANVYFVAMYNPTTDKAFICPIFSTKSNPNALTTGNIHNAILSSGNALKCFEALANVAGQSTDPYDDDGEEGGGDGNKDNPDEDIPLPELPELSAVNCGLVTLFSATEAQIRGLASWMWSDLFDIITFKKLFDSPMDCILGLSIVPLNLSGTVKEIKLGNTGTQVYAQALNTQYVRVDCGSIKIDGFYNNFFDYSPYTKIDIHLPFCGNHALDVDDVMGKSIQVVYDFDVLSGSCVAHIRVYGENSEKVLYSFAGQCSISVPVTSREWGQTINGAINAVSGIVGASMTGNVGGLVQGGLGALQSTKPAYKRSGSLSGPSGMFDIKKPYVVITRPNASIAPRQNTFKGYPLNSTKKLSTLKGYTVVDTIHLENISATDDEKMEIETLLKGGVII